MREIRVDRIEHLPGSPVSRMILLRDHVRVVADVFELEVPSTRRLTSSCLRPRGRQDLRADALPRPGERHRRKPPGKHGILCRGVVTRA